MNNFSHYLNLKSSTINNIFNTITKEGQELIYFKDVVDIIQFFEENRENDNEINQTVKNGLSLNVFEMKIILENFEELCNVKNAEDMVEIIDGAALMFTVDFESENGKNSAPEIFTEINIEMLYANLMNDPQQLKTSILNKLESKMQSNPDQRKSIIVVQREDQNTTINKPHPPSRASNATGSKGNIKKPFLLLNYLIKILNKRCKKFFI